MTPEELCRLEAAKRGLRRERRMLTLKDLKELARVSLKCLKYQIYTGSLKAEQAPHRSGYRWEVEESEAKRWLRSYCWNARRPDVIHWRHRR